MRIGLFAVNWRAPADQAPRMRTPVAARNPSLSGCGRLGREEPLEVIGVVEHERAVDHADRRVQRAERRSALDVHVDVAGRDRRDPVGVTAELAGAEDLDRHADVGGGELVGDDLGAARVLRLGVLVAVGEGQLDRGLRRGRRRLDAGRRAPTQPRTRGPTDCRPPAPHAATRRSAASATVTRVNRVLMSGPPSSAADR